MEVSERLREARSAAGLTQEQVAEALGVSRQTVSNWERGKTYPDIVSAVDLSNLYGISLDAMLKEDRDMLTHLAKSTDIVKSRTRLTRNIQLAVYLVVWAVVVAVFWTVTKPEDAMGYALMAFYVVLPVTTLVLSVLIGRNAELGPKRFAAAAFFSVMYLLATYATFDAANGIETGTMPSPEWGALIPGAVVSAIGLAIGAIAHKIEAARA